MGTVTRSTDIDASPERVWEVLEDVARLPELSESTAAVRVDGPLRSVGQEFEQTVRVAGRSFTSTWSVLEVAPAERLVIEGSVAPGTRYRMIEQLEASSGGAQSATTTRLSLTMEYRLPLGPLGRLAGRLGVEQLAVSEAEQVLEGVRRAVEDPPDRRTEDP